MQGLFNMLRLANSFELCSVDCMTDFYMVFDKNSGKAFKLNESAFFILKKISSGDNIATVKELFLKEYDCDNVQLERDFQEIVSEFVAKSILVEM